MTTSPHDDRAGSPDPYEEHIPDNGKTAIMLPLVVCAALLVGAVMFWQAYDYKARVCEMASVEELVRLELREAYGNLRNGHPDAALKIIGEAGENIGKLKTGWSADYAELKSMRLLIEAEAELLQNPRDNAKSSEEKFSQALATLNHATGEYWLFGLYGRARARLELGMLEESIEDFNLLLSRNPGFGSAYYWRAIAKNKVYDYDGAAEDMKQARRLDSCPPLRDFMRGDYNCDRDIIRRPKT